MLRWFRSAPECPVSLTDKVWTELRLAWLISKLGSQPILDLRMVLPTPEFFPDPYDASVESVKRLFHRVAAFMGLPPDRVELGFFDGMIEHHEWGDANGLYFDGNPERIFLNSSSFHDPESLTATCAHELAHAILLGDKLLTSDAADHEFVTDLVTVFRGLGVFGANTRVREKYWSAEGMHYSQLQLQGYLSERTFGYALALFAWLRNEERPEWHHHLRANVRGGVEAGLRFLTKTGDSLIDRDNLEKPFELVAELTLDKVRNELTSPSASRRLAMLWNLRRNVELAKESLAHVRSCVEDSNRDLAAEAMELLCRLKSDAKPLVSVAMERSLGDDQLLQAGAAKLLQAADDTDQNHAAELIRRLRSRLDRQESLAPAPRFLPGGASAMILPPTEEMLRTLRIYRNGLKNPRHQLWLLEVLRDAAKGHINIAEPAVETLALIGPIATEVLDELLDLLNDPDRNLIPTLYQALVQIAPDEPRVLEALRNGVRERDNQLAASAAHALAKLGARAKSAVPELLKLRKRKDVDLIVAVADALARIDGRHLEALEVFQSALPFPFTPESLAVPHDPRVLSRIEESLKELGIEIIEPILTRVDAQSPDGQCFAFWAIGLIGPDDERCRQFISSTIKSSDRIGRWFAVAALYRCHYDPSVVAKHMLDLALSPVDISSDSARRIDESIRRSARSFLALIGRAAVVTAMEQLASRPADEQEGLQELLGWLFVSVPNVDNLQQQGWLSAEPCRNRFEQAWGHRQQWGRLQREQLERSRSVPPLPEIEALVRSPWTYELINSAFLTELADLSH